MPTANWKGVLVPEPADGLIDALTKQAESLQVVIPVASIAAARTLLTQAATAGAVISQTKPALFRVGGAEGVYYECVGKNAEGVWVLRPFNEVEVDEAKYSLGSKLTVTTGKFSAMCTANLPTRPYDRVITATASSYGAATGNVDLCLRMGATTQGQTLARFSSGDAHNVTVTNTFIYRAGEAPLISLGVLGGSGGGGTVQLSSDERLTRMICIANPISMN